MAAAFATPPPDGKLASRVADRIVDDVIVADWPVGEVLGSEPELLERYGVSRAVFREAVRLVEHQHVARMRRGPGGGLVVTEPSIEAIIDATLLYLHRVDARLDEVFEARVILEELVIDVAVERLTADDVEHLRQIVDQEQAGDVRNPRTLHGALAAATRNPAFELFVDLLNQMTLLYMSDPAELTPKVRADAHRAHARIVDAVAARDAAAGRRRMRRHLDAEADFLRRRRSTRQALRPIGEVDTGGKRAEEVAREIFQRVVSGHLQPGDLVGSEPELMEQYGVSRAIIREAVRLLEHNHLAAMRRGPGGGLFVSAPSPEAVTDIVAIHLERHGITAAQVFEVRSGVETAMVDVVIDHMDAEAEARLRVALADELEASDDEFTAAAHDLHAVIAAVTQNRVLELLALVLIRLSRLHEVGTLASRARGRVGAEVSRAHTAITDAIVDGDRALARRRMDRHMEVLAAFFR